MLPGFAVGLLPCINATYRCCWLGHPPQNALLLQIEDCDQTTVTALSEWDDGRALEGYSFTTDDYAAPNSPDGMRKLAYRSATARHSTKRLLVVPGCSVAAARSAALVQACCAQLKQCCCRCRFRHIVGLYAKGLDNLAESLAQHEQWLSLYGDTDRLTSGWLSHGVSLLKECTERAAALAQDVSVASSQASGNGPLTSCLSH